MPPKKKSRGKKLKVSDSVRRTRGSGSAVKKRTLATRIKPNFKKERPKTIASININVQKERALQILKRMIYGAFPQGASIFGEMFLRVIRQWLSDDLVKGKKFSYVKRQVAALSNSPDQFNEWLKHEKLLENLPRPHEIISAQAENDDLVLLLEMEGVQDVSDQREALEQILDKVKHPANVDTLIYLLKEEEDVISRVLNTFVERSSVDQGIAREYEEYAFESPFEELKNAYESETKEKSCVSIDCEDDTQCEDLGCGPCKTRRVQFSPDEASDEYESKEVKRCTRKKQKVKSVVNLTTIMSQFDVNKRNFLKSVISPEQLTEIVIHLQEILNSVNLSISEAITLIMAQERYKILMTIQKFQKNRKIEGEEGIAEEKTKLEADLEQTNNDVVEMISQQRQRIMELKERRGEEYKLDDNFEKILDKILPGKLELEKVSQLPIAHSQVSLDDEGKKGLVDVYQILLDMDNWQPLNFARTFPSMDKLNRPRYISFEDAGPEDALSLAKKSLLVFMNTTLSQIRPEDVGYQRSAERVIRDVLTREIEQRISGFVEFFLTHEESMAIGANHFVKSRLGDSVDSFQNSVVSSLFETNGDPPLRSLFVRLAGLLLMFPRPPNEYEHGDELTKILGTLSFRIPGGPFRMKIFMGLLGPQEALLQNTKSKLLLYFTSLQKIVENNEESHILMRRTLAKLNDAIINLAGKLALRAYNFLDATSRSRYDYASSINLIRKLTSDIDFEHENLVLKEEIWNRMRITPWEHRLQMELEEKLKATKQAATDRSSELHAIDKTTEGSGEEITRIREQYKLVQEKLSHEIGKLRSELEKVKKSRKEEGVVVSSKILNIASVCDDISANTPWDQVILYQEDDELFCFNVFKLFDKFSSTSEETEWRINPHTGKEFREDFIFEVLGLDIKKIRGNKKNYLLRKVFHAIREDKKDIEVPNVPLSYNLSWLTKFVMDSVSDLIEEEDSDESEYGSESGSESDFEAIAESRDEEEKSEEEKSEEETFGFGSPELCKICGQTHKTMNDPAGIRKAVFSSLKKEGKEDKEARKAAEMAEMAHLSEDIDQPEKSSGKIRSEDACHHCKKQLGPRSFKTVISKKDIEHIGFCVDCFETGELK